MAFVDLTSTVVASEADAIWDQVNSDYLRPSLQLLPPGRAWPRFGLLAELVEGLTWEFSRVARRGRELLDEFDPRTTRQLLPDWERVLGLPECSQPTTLQGRRDAVVSKLQAALGHDQSIGYWTELAKSLGFEIFDFEIGPGPFNVLSNVVDSLGSEEWEWTWSIIANHGGADQEALLECYVAHNASIETLPLTHYRYNVKNSKTTEDLEGVASGTGGDLLVVGRTGVVLYSTDHGENWEEATFLPDDTFGVAYNTGHWMAGGVDGTVYDTYGPIDAITWGTAVPLGFEIYAVDGVAALPGAFHVGTESADPKVRYTLTDGGTWPAGTNNRPIARDMYGATHDGTAWVQVGTSGAVFRSIDSGSTWSSISSGVTEHLHAVAAWVGVMVAVGENGTIIRSTNSGSSWSTVSSGTPKHLYGVAAGETLFYAVGQDGLILESDDQGQTWVQAPTQPTTDTLRAACVHNGRLVAVGDNGVIVTE